MSADRPELVRELLDEWNRGEVDSVIGRATDDFEWHPALVQSMEAAVFRGPDGFRRFLQDWEETWESFTVEVQELREYGVQVLALTRVRAKGRGSGVEIDQPFAHLFEFRDQLVCRAQTFFDRDEAAEAARSRAGRA